MPRKKPPDNNAPDNLPLSGDWSVIKAGLQESLEQGRADRVETQTYIINGSLLLRDKLRLSIGRMYATYRTQILTFDESFGSVIAIILGIPETQSHIVRKIIKELAYDMVGGTIKGMTRFVKNNL